MVPLVEEGGRFRILVNRHAGINLKRFKSVSIMVSSRFKEVGFNDHALALNTLQESSFG
jgi:hypothetical protein